MAAGDRVHIDDLAALIGKLIQSAAKDGRDIAAANGVCTAQPESITIRGSVVGTALSRTTRTEQTEGASGDTVQTTDAGARNTTSTEDAAVDTATDAATNDTATVIHGRAVNATGGSRTDEYKTYEEATSGAGTITNGSSPASGVPGP